MNLCIWLRINAHTEDRNYPLFKTRTVYTVTTAPKEVPRRLRFRSGKRNQRLAQKPVSDNRLSGLGCRSLPLGVAGHLRRHTESWGVESTPSMDRFPNDREALDFIASRIADEAQRDSVALSEVERKMLYFSETAWTLPDILDINDEFDRDYDQGTYEKKISRLIKKAVSRARNQQPEEFEAWTEAAQRLSKEDRYPLVMVEQAHLGPAFRPSRRPWDLWKLWGTGIAIVGLFGGLVWFINKLFPETNLPPLPRRGNTLGGDC